MNPSKPVVGIGACLVGQPVRYNGESQRKNHAIEALKHHLTMKPFCPEMAIGLGVPRPTVRLVGEAGGLRLMDSATQSRDYTEPMRQYALDTAARHRELTGYILVKGSPSCGFERVKRYHRQGHLLARDCTGLFASELMKRDPLLPMEEDGRLHDHALRENFVGRVYAYHDWKQFSAGGVTLDRGPRGVPRRASHRSIGQFIA